MRASRYLAFIVVFAMALAAAPAANAARSILGEFGVETTPAFESGPGGLLGPSALFVDPGSPLPTAGDIYDSGGGYLQQFAASGERRRLWGANVVEAGPGDADETQAVRVSATGGDFTLSFARTLAAGAGGTAPGSTTVTNVKTTSGAFSPGQEISATISAANFSEATTSVIPPGTTIVAVDLAAKTITLSQAATDFAAGAELLVTDSLSSSTGPIAFDAPASGPGSVEEALNALPSVNGGGGSVSVSGGAGDASGSEPYIVSFDGGPLANTNQPLIVADDSALTGDAAAYTTNPGHTGFEICNLADGDVCRPPTNANTARLSLLGAVPGAEPGSFVMDPATGDIFSRSGLRRVSHYSPTGEFLGSFGWDVVRQGPGDSGVDEVQQLEVKAVSDTYKLGLFINNQGQQETAGIPFNASAAQIEAAIEKMKEFADFGGSVSVTGSNPYTVTFDGVSGGDSYRELTFLPSTAGTVAALQDGGGPEVCTSRDSCKQGERASSTNEAGGDTQLAATVEFDGAIAVVPPGPSNQGNVLIGGEDVISEFTSEGVFARAFGLDVIKTGPNKDLAAPNEVQRVTVKADGGTFRLGYNFFFPGLSEQATDPIPFNATAAELESALEAVTKLGGDVTVTGGPGNLTGTNPYVITFEGAQAGNDVQQLLSNVTALTSSTGGKLVDITTLTPGGSFEVCRVADGDVCVQGVAGSRVGQFDGASGSIAAADDGTIYAVDDGNQRVQRFAPSGGDDLEPSLFGVEETQELTVNAAAGEFRLSVGGSPQGTVGTGDLVKGAKVITDVNTTSGEFRVGLPIETFGSGVTGIFGNSTIITAVEGDTLRLSGPIVNTKSDEPLRTYLPHTTPDLPFNAPASGSGSVEEALNALPAVSGGAIGKGNISNASQTVSGLATTAGVFAVGQAITSPGPAGGIPAGTTIIATAGSSITLSQPATATAAGVSITSTAGGSVTVTGGPGGANPYLLEFNSPVPFVDVPDVGTYQGGVPLSGGSGQGANRAVATTLTDGGPNGLTSSSGFGSGDSPSSVGVQDGGNVFVSRSYKPMDSVCPDGSPITYSASASRYLEFTPDGNTLVGTSLPCVIEPDFIFDEGTVESAGGGAVRSIDPVTGVVYRGQVWSGDVGTPPDLNLNPVGGITSAGATISGTIDPNNPAGAPVPPVPAVTRYQIEFRRAGDPEWTQFISRVPLGFSDAPVSFSLGLNGLEPKLEYEVRVLVVKPYGFAPLRQIQTFTTKPGVPRIDSPFSENVTASSADLRAAVNPSGAETTYRFEYGKTPSYGLNTPAVNIGEGSDPVDVQAHIEGLEPFTYHFRVVATNSEGTTVSPDQTFNFYPEPCPNSAARQQTGATRLPDCRAYELVSPAKMGSVSLSGGTSSPYASNPSRLMFSAELGVLPGPWNPPNTSDAYVATREPSGWETHYVGVQAHEQGDGGQLEESLSLYRFLQHSLNTDLTGPSSAPYVFDAEGNMLGRLPTNLSDIPGGDAPTNAGGFVGDQRLSGDGNHFFYSAVNVELFPGGLTSGAGSVYRNDIESETVEIVSKTEGGVDIPPAPGAKNDNHFIRLPGVSRDGSHVLMAATDSCASGSPPFVPCSVSPAILYMWVDGAGSYDVSEGRVVTFEGMSADGSEVFFTTDEKFPGTGDTDKSTDLFMWSEAGDSVTRVSAGADPVGNTNACNSPWASDCDIEFVDGSVAPDGGSAYFYSPEQLVGSDGFPGRRNLYLHRGGALQFVGSVESANPVTDIQASGDGRFGAFTSRSRLTSYDNTGVGTSCVSVDNFGKPTSPRCVEMYLFDAQEDVLVCASCQRTGEPPSHNVATGGGAFLTDDGRVFLETKEALVPADTDGLNDVYEYVGSSAHLITTGVAAQEKGGIGSAGLVGVSANGIDVYFSTLESLDPRDENGPFLKFYDARTNGGFPLSPPIQPCAAADECHGADGSEPQAPRLSSQADLGGAGNVTPGPTRKKKRCASGKRSAKSKQKTKRCGKRRAGK